MLGKKSIRVKWAQRILKAKFFVALTEKDAVIYLKGADPTTFEDETALVSQAVTIDTYIKRLQQLRRSHDQVLESKFGKKPAKSKKPTTKKATKIKVKKG